MQISRSEQKRRIKEIERLVVELVTLPPQVLSQAPFPTELGQMLLETAKLQGSVRQRQVKYLTKLVREHPVEELYELVGQHRGKTLAAQKQVHALEFYRDTLINEALEKQEQCRQDNLDWGEDWASDTLVELRTHMPEIDLLTLSRLSYLFARTRNPRYSREIFRYLRSVQELQQRNSSRSGEMSTHVRNG
jgi:ribosome-associated protein